ncbi:MAG: TIR domain-containing protein [Thermodesulfobacteriota bacterium]
MTTGRTSKTSSPTRLLVPREEAIRRIKEQIKTGRHIREQRLSSMADLESAQEKRTTWMNDNIRMLDGLVNNPLFEDEYNMRGALDLDSAITFSLKEKYFRDDINEQIGRLESLLEHLKLIPEITAEELVEQKLAEVSIKQKQPKEIESMEAQLRQALTTELPPSKQLPAKDALIEKPHEEESLREAPPRREPAREKLPPKRVPTQSQLPEGHVLLIHGHDEATKESVLEFLETLGLHPIVLHEQPDGGKHMIERVGDSPGIYFAIVLLTPDEIAAPQQRPKERQVRVSQNVIFEFGYLLCKLGHGRVCALYKEGVEIPSNDLGAPTIPMDSRGTWRLLIAKEMKQAGVDVDLNKAI